MVSMTRLARKSGSVHVVAGGRKATSYGVTSAVKMSAIDVHPSHHGMKRDLRGSISSQQPGWACSSLSALLWKPASFAACLVGSRATFVSISLPDLERCRVMVDEGAMDDDMDDVFVDDIAATSLQAMQAARPAEFV